MKQRVQKLAMMITALSLTVATSALATPTDPMSGIKCKNQIYRDAALTIGDVYGVSIQDSSIENQTRLEREIENSLGLQDNTLRLLTVKLRLSANAVQCENFEGLLFNCTGASDFANLSVHGVLMAPVGGGGAFVELTVPVRVKDFALKTSLKSRGPHKIGGDSNVIPVNDLQVDAGAEVQIGENVISLRWTPFFKAFPRSKISQCVVE